MLPFLDRDVTGPLPRWEASYCVTELVGGRAAPQGRGGVEKNRNSNNPRPCGEPFALIILFYPQDDPLGPMLLSPFCRGED